MTIPYPFASPTAPIALAIHLPAIGGFGPFELDIRWYALAYIAGLLIGWRYCLALARQPPVIARALDIDDFLVWATLGVVLGGRTGYVLYAQGIWNVSSHELWRRTFTFNGQ